MRTFKGKLLVSLIAFGVGVACFYLWHLRRADSRPAARPVVTPQPIAPPQAQTDASNAPRGPVGEIDFRNFNYPNLGGKGLIRMKGGEIEYEDGGCLQRYAVQDVSYLDFTGDGEDEALVRLVDHVACGSSWAAGYYYVYAVRGGRPRLLWSFATGSEAHGGEKDFRVEGTELVFELYGMWRVAGGKLSFKENRQFADDCCPTHYTVARVAWDGKRFRHKSVEVLSFAGKTVHDR